MNRGVAALGMLIVALGASDARADIANNKAEDEAAVCGDRSAEPALVSFGPGGLDTPRSACTASTDSAFARVIAGLGPAALGDVIEQSLYVQRRWLTRTGFELELGARLVRYTAVDGQDLSGDAFEVGPVVVGAADGEDTDWLGMRGRWTAQLRLELPRTDSGLEVTALSAAPAFTWSAAATDTLRLHTRAGLLLFATPGTEPLEARASGSLSVDATLVLSSWLVATGGLEGQGALDDPGFDHALVRGGLQAGKGIQGALSLGVPVAGDREDGLVVVLSVVRRR